MPCSLFQRGFRDRPAARAGSNKPVRTKCPASAANAHTDAIDDRGATVEVGQPRRRPLHNVEIYGS